MGRQDSPYYIHKRHILSTPYEISIYSLSIRHKSRKTGSLEDNDSPLFSAGLSYGVKCYPTKPSIKKGGASRAPREKNLVKIGNRKVRRLGKDRLESFLELFRIVRFFVDGATRLVQRML